MPPVRLSDLRRRRNYLSMWQYNFVKMLKALGR